MKFIFFEYACQKLLGRRDKQEDALLIWTSNVRGLLSQLDDRPNNLLAILADGMGGHVAGEFASQIVCTTFRDTFSDIFQKLDRRNVSFALNAALQAANTKLNDIASSNIKFAGMGSTLLAVFFYDECLHWISVGDSLLYLFRQDKITLLNEDHSMAPLIERENCERGLSCINQIKDGRHNILRSALTGGGISLVDLTCCPLQLKNSDYIILASDGILTLPITEVERKLSLSAERGPLCVAQTIIEDIECIQEPNQDNTSLIIVRSLDQLK